MLKTPAWLPKWVRQRRTLGAIFSPLVGVIYLAILLKFRWLTFPLRLDEPHFWTASLTFSTSFIPSMATLRGYNELNTPLPFYLFGQLHRLTGAGISASRYLNLAASLGTIFLVARTRGYWSLRAMLAAFGLMSFPYFLGTAIHIYTDPLAVFFAVGGVAGYLRRSFGWCSIFFILAIASRQYMVAFPAGIIVYEVLFKQGERFEVAPVIASLVACASLGVWMLLFGGFGPPAAVAVQHIATARLFVVMPRNSLLCLSCIGAYYCVVEMLLFRKAPKWPGGDFTAWSAALILAVLFFMSPPRQNTHVNQQVTMGYLDKLLVKIFDDPPTSIEGSPREVNNPSLIVLPPITSRGILRITAYYLLALLAVWRFMGMPLEAILISCNAALMMKSHIAWDKYSMGIIAVLWLLRGAVKSAARPRRFTFRGDCTYGISQIGSIGADGAAAFTGDGVVRRIG